MFRPHIIKEKKSPTILYTEPRHNKGPPLPYFQFPLSIVLSVRHHTFSGLLNTRFLSVRKKEPFVI